MSQFEISGDVSNNKIVPTISPNDLKAVKKLIKRLTVGFRANRNIGESKWLAQKNINIKTRPQVEACSLVNSKEPYILQIYPNFESSGSIGTPTSSDLSLSNYRPSGKSITEFPLSMTMRGITIICLDAPKPYKKSFGRRSPGMLPSGGGR